MAFSLQLMKITEMVLFENNRCVFVSAVLGMRCSHLSSGLWLTSGIRHRCMWLPSHRNGHIVINYCPSVKNLAPSTICLGGGGKNSLPSLQLALTYGASLLGGRSRHRAHWGDNIFCRPRAHCHIVCQEGRGQIVMNKSILEAFWRWFLK